MQRLDSVFIDWLISDGEGSALHACGITMCLHAPQMPGSQLMGSCGLDLESSRIKFLPSTHVKSFFCSECFCCADVFALLHDAASDEKVMGVWRWN